MRIADVRLNKPTVISVICSVCALLSLVGVVDAANHPAPQSTQPEKAASATQLDAEQKSSQALQALRKLQRNDKTFQLRRQVVLDFLEQNFPELQASLLKSEVTASGKFRSAVKRIGKEVTRLQKIKQNQPAKFELSVKQWKLKTKIEITIAQYAKKETDDQIKQRLTPLVEQMLDNQKLIFERERKLATQKISRIDEHLLKLENKRDRVLRYHLKSFQKSVGEVRDKKKLKALQRQSQKSETEPGTDLKPIEKNK